MDFMIDYWRVHASRDPHGPILGVPAFKLKDGDKVHKQVYLF